MRLFTTLILLAGCLLLQPAFGQNAFPVRFTQGTEFFPDNFQAIRQQPAVSPAELVNGYYFRFIQCRQLPSAAERARLEAGGVQFISYVHFGAYLVALPQQFDYAQFDALQVRSVVPVQPHWKMARTLLEEPYGAWAVHGNLIDVEIQVYPQLRIADGAERCRQAGFTVLREGNQNGYLGLRVPKEKIAELAALPFIRHLELAPPPSEPEDTGSRALHRSNLLDSDHALGTHYNGEGVSTLVRDDGPIGPHVDFKGRLDNLGTLPSPGDINHADWVGSCVGGAGNIDPTAKGMASGATVYALNYLASFQDETLPLHLSKNITLTNTSYSNGCNDGYTLASQTVDQQLYDHPTLLHVFSAGNSNGSNCDYGAGNQWGNITGGHKMSKNSIAVANLAADGTINSTSSRGPAHDGRLKPEIAAHGTDVNMAQPNNKYSVTTGTSFAAPNVAGCFAQLTQIYKLSHNGDQPDAALLKAAVMNTANDLGNPGPDFKFGWGHINVFRAKNLLEKNNFVKGSVEQAGESVHSLTVPNGTRQLRAMIYWLEPPAAENAARALINDLDLTIVAPDATAHLPWKLDPTPDAAILDSPAGKGRDSLNNFEQVLVDNPAPGTYNLTVKGFEVPLGPQSYVVVWEMLNDDIKLTYPAGGEGFVPGEKIRIQWDAHGTANSFTLRYSADNGATFTPITTITGENRAYDWTIPNALALNGQVRMLLIRSNKRDTTDFAFSVSPIPTNIKVEKVCPDSMTVAWTGVNDTLNSDVYLLGEKYMEIVGTSDTNFLTFPLPYPGQQNWVSVRTSHPNGLTGRRALAIESPGGLKNCPQEYDIATQLIVAPASTRAISCGAIQGPVSVSIKNDGLNPISGATIQYQKNDEPTVSEPLPDIQPDKTLLYTFQNLLPITENGDVRVKVWCTFGQDKVGFNDTLETAFFAIVKPQGSTFQENFEGTEYPPYGWSLVNPDESVTLSPAPGEITGANGQPTHAVRLNCFNYSTKGQKDYLYLIPLDLSGWQSPGLQFDLAHANFDNTYSDSLSIEVFPACDTTAAPTVIWKKGGPTLATTDATESEFTPDDASDWRQELASLKNFAGQQVLIRIVSTNDFGNNIYIDNINFDEYNVSPAVAEIMAQEDTICRLDTLIFTAGQALPDANYSWQFGTGSQPSIAVGPGPHSVRYLTTGNKTVRLVASNLLGADTAIQTVTVRVAPSATFTTALNGLTATFTNNSLNAQSFFWDFGDTTNSTEKNPVHQFTAAGDYTVTLISINPCDTTVKTQKITVTGVGTKELPELRAVRVLPNPTAGDFQVELTGATTSALQLTLLDAQGRRIKTVSTGIFPGVSIVPFEGLGLPKGSYQLQVQTESGVRVFSVVVQ